MQFAAGGVNDMEAGAVRTVRQDVPHGKSVRHPAAQSGGDEQLAGGHLQHRRKALHDKAATPLEEGVARAMEDATGRSWEDFLTDWLFNVGDYVDQNMDWFE